jgi:hypothetical protein
VLVAAAFGWQLGRKAAVEGRRAERAGGEPAAPAESAARRSVLFIGNSHSAPIPAALEALARAAGVDIAIEQITPGGARLIEHAQNRATLEAIAKRKRDFVVLQEQAIVPGVPTLRQTLMLPAARKLCRVARETGSQPVLYLTWAREKGDQVNQRLFPLDTFEAMQVRVTAGYREAARQTGARIAPVGLAWQAAMRERPDIQLFDPDGMHASPAGVHLAASVFLAALFDRDPSRIEDAKAPAIPGIVPEQSLYLRRLAQRTVSAFGR